MSGENPKEPETPPGWYSDPEMAGTQRYWDGSRWTDHRAPLAKSTEHPKNRGTAGAAVLLVAAAVALGLVAAVSPTLNIPVISEAVCSMKGHSWFDEPDALYGVERAGCYSVNR